MQNTTWWSLWLHNLLLTPKHKNVSMSANTHQLYYLEKAECAFVMGSTDTSKCWLCAPLELPKLHCSSSFNINIAKCCRQTLLIQRKGHCLLHQRWGCWTRKKPESKVAPGEQTNKPSSIHYFPDCSVQALLLLSRSALKQAGSKANAQDRECTSVTEDYLWLHSNHQNINTSHSR